MNKSERNNAIDVIKGIAIVLVVLGHCIQFGSGNDFLSGEAFYDSMLFKIIYSFHMPLFMLVSGFLGYKSIEKHGTRKHMVHQIRSQSIPIVTWSVILYVLKGISGSLSGGTLNLLKEYVWTFLGTLWFLWALIMCSCVFCLLYSISKGKWWIHLLTILTFFVIPDRFNLVYFKFLYPYYVVGFYWNKQISVNEGILYNMWTTVRRKRRAMITGGLFWVASFAGLLCFFNRDAFIYSTGVMIDFGNAPMRQIGIDVYRWAIGYVGALIPIGTVTLIRKLTDCKWLAYFGARSLGIYITNTYINLYVLKFITWEFQFNWVMLLIETILVTVICCVFAELLRQSKITKKLFLGR